MMSSFPDECGLRATVAVTVQKSVFMRLPKSVYPAVWLVQPDGSDGAVKF